MVVDVEFPFGERSVRRLGLGAAGMAAPDGGQPPVGRDTAVAVLRQAVDDGVNLIDTAECSGAVPGVIREALHPYPDDLLLVSTVGQRRDHARPPAGRPEQLRADVLASLRALGAEQLAALTLWLPDPADGEADLDGQLDALTALRDEGLIAEIGLGNVTLDALEHATGRTEITCVQGAFTVLDRSSEPLLWACARQGIAFVPVSPLGSVVSPPGSVGPTAGGADPVLTHPPVTTAAGRLGVTAAQVVLAWHLTFAPNILLTPAIGSVGRLREVLAAGDVELDRTAIADLDAP